MDRKVNQSGYHVGSLALLLLLGSCAATVATPKLYLLTSKPATAISPGAACAPVAVTVQLPAYLQRDGLVLQVNDNELVAADRHLWAEPLVYGVERLLTVCLNPAAYSERVVANAGAVQQVKVVVEQLHGTADGVSRLQATWSKTNANDADPSGSKRFSAQALQDAPGYDALVSVQRGLLLDLCEKITEQLAHCAE